MTSAEPKPTEQTPAPILSVDAILADLRVIAADDD